MEADPWRAQHHCLGVPPKLVFSVSLHPGAGLGTLEVAAARRDRGDLVLPSPCFKLILARPAELHVTTVRGREYA